jgi:cyclopropane fatty-acyl-phospholipid synthase-like methyltransferase
MQTLLNHINSYFIDKDSSFLDIGHGFGKVVLFMAAHTQMNCYGVEVAPFRADYS